MPDPFPLRSTGARDYSPSADPDAAFTALVETQYARLGAFAFRLVGSRAAAEDVVHEVLLRVWRRRHDFAFNDPLRYLYQAVRNEAESWRRREARQRYHSGAEPGLEAQPDPRADAGRSAELGDLVQIVEDTVAALPPRRREIFRMQREQGLSYAEIASLLGISVKTVEIQIGNALKAIRRRLGPLLGMVLVVFK